MINRVWSTNQAKKVSKQLKKSKGSEGVINGLNKIDQLQLTLINLNQLRSTSINQKESESLKIILRFNWLFNQNGVFFKRPNF